VPTKTEIEPIISSSASGTHSASVPALHDNDVPRTGIHCSSVPVYESLPRLECSFLPHPLVHSESAPRIRPGVPPGL